MVMRSGENERFHVNLIGKVRKMAAFNKCTNKFYLVFLFSFVTRVIKKENA